MDNRIFGEVIFPHLKQAEMNGEKFLRMLDFDYPTWARLLATPLSKVDKVIIERVALWLKIHVLIFLEEPRQAKKTNVAKLVGLVHRHQKDPVLALQIIERKLPILLNPTARHMADNVVMSEFDLLGLLAGEDLGEISDEVKRHINNSEYDLDDLR